MDKNQCHALSLMPKAHQGTGLKRPPAKRRGSRDAGANDTWEVAGENSGHPKALSGSGLRVGLGGYLLAIAIGEVRGMTPPEICDAIRNATTTAGTLIILRN
jgi:hypothetical protein